MNPGRRTEKLRERLRLLERIVDSLPDGVLAIDREGKVILWNRAVEEMTGARREEVLGRGEYAHAVPFYGERRPILVNIVLGNGKEWERKYEKVKRKGQVLTGEGFAPYGYGGRGLHFWSLAAPICDEEGNLVGAVQCIRDIGERRQMEDELRHWSTHDALTGLYNRAFFEEELRRLEKGRSFPVSFILCDLDGLKVVNDALGHERGDELLRRAAGVIASCVRGSDLVARVGGDEFAVVLPQTDRAAAEEVAGRITQAVEEENAGRPEIPLSISVGTATAEDPGRPLVEAYKEADDAMYRDKLARGAEPRGAVVRVLRAALAERDCAAAGHAERVKELACALGEAVGLSHADMDKLRLLADVHDIGKLGVSERVLSKTALTDEEREEFKRYPEVGYRIALSSLELAPVAELIRQHHEWWNGQGYPRGLAGEEIHILSRILALADAYDTLTSDPPASRALSHGDALAEIQKRAGVQFDPQLAEVFVSLMSERGQPSAAGGSEKKEYGPGPQALGRNRRKREGAQSRRE